MDCFEEPGLEEGEDVDDPDWHCQMEEKGEEDIDADDEETNHQSTSNIRQDPTWFKIFLLLLFLLKFFFYFF